MMLRPTSTQSASSSFSLRGWARGPSSMTSDISTINWWYLSSSSGGRTERTSSRITAKWSATSPHVSIASGSKSATPQSAHQRLYSESVSRSSSSLQDKDRARTTTARGRTARTHTLDTSHNHTCHHGITQRRGGRPDGGGGRPSSPEVATARAAASGAVPERPAISGCLLPRQRRRGWRARPLPPRRQPWRRSRG